MTASPKAPTPKASTPKSPKAATPKTVGTPARASPRTADRAAGTPIGATPRTASRLKTPIGEESIYDKMKRKHERQEYWKKQHEKHPTPGTKRKLGGDDAEGTPSKAPKTASASTVRRTATAAGALEK